MAEQKWLFKSAIRGTPWTSWAEATDDDTIRKSIEGICYRYLLQQGIEKQRALGLAAAMRFQMEAYLPIAAFNVQYDTEEEESDE